MHFDEVGAGPAVVLIHGHPFNRSMWSPQSQPLAAAGFRVITPDLRGYGESEATAGTVTMRELAGDIVALLDSLSIKQAAVVGLSMGGLVAMELATETDRVWALGLIATTAEPVSEAEQERRLRLAAAAERDGMAPLIAAMHGQLFGPNCPAHVAETVERMMNTNNPVGAAAALRGRAQRPDYMPKLRTLELPTFVCAGTADLFSTAEVTRQLLECLPEAQTLLLEEVGHMPNLESPTQFNPALIAFLEQAAPPPRKTGRPHRSHD